MNMKTRQGLIELDLNGDWREDEVIIYYWCSEGCNNNVKIEYQSTDLF